MRYALLMLIPFMAVVSSCENRVNSSAPKGFNQKATRLMTIPPGYEAGEVTFSDDGFQVAVVLQKDGKMYMSINSALSPMYDGVRAPAFHAATKQHAFIAKKNDKECVVHNFREGAWYDRIERPLITSDGLLVYAAKRSDKWFIVSGDKVSQPFDSPGPSLFASPDGRRLAYLEQNSVTKKVRLCICSSMLRDYARGREYDEINEVINSSSGSHLAYRVVRNGKGSVVKADVRQPGCVETEGSWYDKIGYYALSNNGEHLAFFATNMNKHYLVNAGKEWPCTDYAMLFEIAVSDKGNALYTGVITDSIIISLDGRVIDDRRESVDELKFNSDSGHYLFVAGPCPFIPAQSEWSALVVDGHKSKQYDKIVGPRFSPDNGRIIFRARDSGGRFLAVADLSGQILREHSRYHAVWEFKFSPDGKSVGYGIRTGQELWWKVEPLL